MHRLVHHTSEIAPSLIHAVGMRCREFGRKARLHEGGVKGNDGREAVVVRDSFLGRTGGRDA
jgi:hypothetical protein